MTEKDEFQSNNEFRYITVTCQLVKITIIIVSRQQPMKVNIR